MQDDASLERADAARDRADAAAREQLRKHHRALVEKMCPGLPETMEAMQAEMRRSADVASEGAAAFFAALVGEPLKRLEWAELLIAMTSEELREAHAADPEKFKGTMWRISQMAESCIEGPNLF